MQQTLTTKGILRGGVVQIKVLAMLLHSLGEQYAIGVLINWMRPTKGRVAEIGVFFDSLGQVMVKRYATVVVVLCPYF